MARFSSPIVAEHAAAYLRANGVRARVVGHLDVLSGVSPSVFHDGGQFIVVIADADDRELAQLLLEEMQDEPMELEEDLDAAARVDLSSLPADLAPVCPRCGRVLAMCSDLVHCPSCAHPVDVEALIVEQHGPEAIADALADRAPDSDRASEDGVQVCPACEGKLEYSGGTGSCPHCGSISDMCP